MADSSRPRPRARVAGLLLLPLLLSSCAVAGRRCENQELARRPAPDGAYDAVLYGRTCDGEATSTNVSLVFSGARVSEDIGNLFQAAGTPDTAAVAVRWEAPHRLVVRHPGEMVVLKREPRLREVAVRYESVSRP